MGLKALGGLVGGFVFIRVIDDGGVESEKAHGLRYHGALFLNDES